MHALSIWPLNSHFCIVPQLELEVGSSCISSTRRRRRRRRKIWYLGDLDSHSKRSSLLVNSSNSRVLLSGTCFFSPKFDLEFGFFSKYPKFKSFVLSDPKMGTFSKSFPMALSLEEQAFGFDTIKKDVNNLGGLSRDIENEDIGCIDSDKPEIRNLALSDNENDNHNEQEKDMKTEKKVGEEKNRKVDVRALASSLQFAKTFDDVEQILKDKGDFLPLQVYSTIIRGLGKEKKLDSAMVLVEWLKQKKKATCSVRPNLFIYNSLLGAVKQSENFGAVEKIMNDMAMENICPNIVTYNTLMGIYLEQGRESEALNLFDEIQKRGLSPSPASYSTALLAYRRLEDGFGALDFYIDFKEKYQKGDMGKYGDEDWESEFTKIENFTVRICYQVMRRWLVIDENLSTKVLKLLTEMDKAGLQNDRTEEERLVWACTREEHCMVAKELYNRIREKNSGISLSVCNHVIWLFGKAKKWWAALEIYEDLLDKGPKPNNMSYELVVSHFNILLTAARKKGIWRWGVRLLNKMEEKGLKPGSREWNSVLVACSKASETSAAVQIFKRMVEQGEKPTVISYGALLSALEKGKLYDEAHRVWDHMIKVGFEPNLYAYTIMASIYSAQGKFDVVDSIIQDMVASGVEPTVVTYNAIISACARNSLGTPAYDWFHRMKGSNILPNEVTYEMLIEALVKDGKPRLAYELYSRAYNEGLKLSSKAYDSVIECSEEFGATIDLSALGPRPPEKKKKVIIRKNLSDFSSLADVPRRGKPFDRKEIYSSQTEGNL